ncbi:Protein-tyrosine sulfotransferase 2 [Branchiostoma belcheri]|nr:Protein-tyrosine sulfotransferase 2 [Branchiostoma belcheri]
MHGPTGAADSTSRGPPSQPLPGYAPLPGYVPGYAVLPNFPAPVPRSAAMMRGGSRRSMLAGLCTFQAFLLMYLSTPCDKGKMIPKEGSQYVYDAENRAYQYDRNMPLIFIGGVPRSGTTLARVMLDAHPSIRCGEETRVIPRILAMQVQWRRSTKEKSRLEEAGVTDEVLDDAISSFVLEVIAKHGEAAPYLCNKDPFTHKSTVYLSSLFPNAKFILMLRDGRAAVHSMITRKVTITGFDLTSYRNSLTKWNQAIENMYSQCVQGEAAGRRLITTTVSALETGPLTFSLLR